MRTDKAEKLKNNELRLHLMELQNEWQNKPKEGRNKEQQNSEQI